MKTTSLTTAILGAAALSLPAQTLLWMDNFDVANIRLNDSATTGRLTGTAAGETFIESHGAHQFITGGQLDFVNAGGVRWGGQTTRYNWAGATTGADILATQGFQVTFDWTHSGDSSEWLAFKVGTANDDTGVNDGSCDHALLLRQGPTATGQTNERWDNGVNLGYSGVDYGAVANTTTTYPVVLKYVFTSFADGSPVRLIAEVNGVEVVRDDFTWDGNGGALHMETHTDVEGNFIDNLAISTLPPLVYEVALDGFSFISGESTGTPIGTLAGELGLTEVNSTFTLVAGEGDDDNAMFQITGDQLEVGRDFTGPNSTDGQVFSIRVRGESTEGGGETGEAVFEITVSKDDDLDDLPDSWELRWTSDLNTLDGLAFTDADNDTLYDFEEYQLSIGQFPNFPAYPDINPLSDDSDGELTDYDELFPISLRTPTDPTNLDTDEDGLSDLAETNTGFYTDANDTGTDPASNDTDLDGSRDNWELTYLNPAAMFDSFVIPDSIAPEVTAVPITDDASSGISTTKVYTHAISGGGSVTIEGVVLDALTGTMAPPNFAWDTFGKTKDAPAANLGTAWNATNGGVTGPGIIAMLTGFTYSGSGDSGGSMQSYTLSGLTPGEDYIARIYLRRFGLSPRPIDITFVNGSQEITPYGALPEDYPSLVLQAGNDDQAYYLNFPYTAEGTELVIRAALHPGVVTASGSFHLYGLTNEVDGAVVSADIVVTGVSAGANGDLTVNFVGSPSTVYNVTKSPDLVTAFAPLASPLTPTTAGDGTGQVVIPAAEFGGATSYFVRIEQ